MKNHQKLYLGLIVLMSWTLAAGCGSSPEEGAATPLSPKEAVVTTTPIHSTTSIPIPTPTPTRMAPAVDATTLSGKTIFGYQGWFSCPGDGSKLENWEHWFIHGAPPVVEALVVDFWPDTSELTPEEKCDTHIPLTTLKLLPGISSGWKNTVLMVSRFKGLLFLKIMTTL
jgi:hypothetical protein